MSFDTVLDYTPVIVGFNAKIAVLQAQNAIDAENLTKLETSVYASIVTNEIQRLTNKIARDLNKINNLQALIDEMTRIQNLPLETKEQIYYFYTVLDVSRNIYMTKLLFNTDAVTDPTVLAIFNDNVTAPDVKLMVAKLVYEKFNMNYQYDEIHYINLYLR